MRIVTRLTMASIAVVIMAGCEIGTGCDAIAKPAVSVSVRDARTGAAIASGATIVVSERDFRDSVIVPLRADADALPFGLAHERAGTYTVVVTRAGYQPWGLAGVRVERGRCNVATATLTAALQPL